MKKLFLFLCGVLSVLSATAQSFKHYYEDYVLTFNVIGDNMVEIKRGEVFVTDSDTERQLSLTLPSSVEFGNTTYAIVRIGSGAFFFGDWIKFLTIPSSVIEIESRAFPYCYRLEGVSIPNSVTSIGPGAFADCKNLTSLSVSEDNLYYTAENNILYNKDMTELVCCPASFTSVVIPPTVTSIGESAFESCSSLISVEIPNTVKSIGEKAFESCSSLSSVSIPNSVTSIAESAFESCSNLSSVSIPGSVTSIGEDAFWRCDRLVKAEFADIASLCSIQFQGVNSNPLWLAKHLYINGEEVTSVVIPESISSIGSYAFFGGEFLSSVSIPTSVTSIGEDAFGFCRSLPSVEIPEAVTSIGEWAFEFCSSLSSVSIPNSVTSIGERAFECCSNLSSVSIPNSVTSIGDGTFSYCSSLTSVYYAANNPISADMNVFSDITYGNATLYVPEAAVGSCKEIDPWKNFTHIIAYDPAGTEDITAGFDDTAPCEYFSLSGVKMGSVKEALAPGVYVSRQGRKTKKITVK